jgi:hypothetical protein
MATQGPRRGSFDLDSSPISARRCCAPADARVHVTITNIFSVDVNFQLCHSSLS